MALAHGTLAWAQLFGGLSRNGLALNVQIRRTIVAAIEAGNLPSEVRMPSSRQLSVLLGIARNTVVSAYEQLIDEGFLVARQRSGIFVAAERAPPLAELSRLESAQAWTARFAVRPSEMQQITKPRDWINYPYPFVFGQFDPTLFPANDWRESVRAACSVAEINVWAGDLVDEDDQDLIEQLRLQVLPRRGILASADEIMITIGSQQALWLLVQLFVGPNSPVGVEDPGYPDIRNMVRMRTSRLEALPVDGSGLVPDAAFARCQVAFVTVGHQCPTTAIMPLSRRRALLEVAGRHDVVLVEDDYDADLSFESGIEIPCLKSLDTDGRVVYVGSFSKVLAPGLRVGYVVAPRAVVAELRVLRRLMLRHPPSNNQRATAMFVALGHYRTHLRRTAAILAERAQLVDGLLTELMPGCHWRRDAGATSFWVEGPPAFDARVLAAAARLHGVLIEPGDIFFADPQAGVACFRLGFASIRTERIEDGLRRLATLMPATVTLPRKPGGEV